MTQRPSEISKFGKLLAVRKEVIAKTIEVRLVKDVLVGHLDGELHGVVVYVGRDVDPPGRVGRGVVNEAAYREGVGPPIFKVFRVSPQNEPSVADVGITGLDLSCNHAANWRPGDNELDKGIVPDVVFLVNLVKDSVGCGSHLRDVMHARGCHSGGSWPSRGHESAGSDLVPWRLRHRPGRSCGCGDIQSNTINSEIHIAT